MWRKAVAVSLWSARHTEVSALESDSFLVRGRRCVLGSSDSVVVLSEDPPLNLSPPSVELRIISIFPSVIPVRLAHVLISFIQFRMPLGRLSNRLVSKEDNRH